MPTGCRNSTCRLQSGREDVPRALRSPALPDPCVSMENVTYTIAAETVEETRSRGLAAGRKHKRPPALTPGPSSHAIADGATHTSCGKDAEGLLLLPDLSFGEFNVTRQCPDCRAAV